MENKKSKIIVTVVGMDTVGIIARVCTYFAENEINVLDISQTIVSGYFNMMMIVELQGQDQTITRLIKDLDELGKDIGVSIKCQREEIFQMMHRV